MWRTGWLLCSKTISDCKVAEGRKKQRLWSLVHEVNDWIWWSWRSFFSSLDDSIVLLDEEKKGLSSAARGLLRGLCFTAVPPSERAVVFWESITCTSNFLPLKTELKPWISILNLRFISMWLFPHTPSVGHAELTFHFSALHTSLLLSTTPVFDSSFLLLLLEMLSWILWLAGYTLSWLWGNTASRDMSNIK